MIFPKTGFHFSGSCYRGKVEILNPNKAGGLLFKADITR
jgi:hypothetical protein